MLILTRRAGEAIIVDEGDNETEIRVLGIDSRGKVRLGIAAPQHIRVDREEVRERIEQEGRA